MASALAGPPAWAAILVALQKAPLGSFLNPGARAAKALEASCFVKVWMFGCQRKIFLKY